VNGPRDPPLDPRFASAEALDPKSASAEALDPRSASAEALDPKSASARALDPKSASAKALDAPEVLARFHAELDLVEIIARQMGRRIAKVVTLDDLRSFGREGLLQAARTFDESRGVPFRRWANLRIRGAIIDGVRAWGGLPRRIYRELRALEAGDAVVEAFDEADSAAAALTPEAADAKLTGYLAGMATAIALGRIAPSPSDSAEPPESRATPEELVAEAELAARVREAVATLPDRERVLIERHYFAGETLDAAAAALGLSKSWGSRLHARAIEGIARELERRAARKPPV